MPAVATAPRTQGTASDLAQLVDHRPVDQALLDAMLRLFDGHDVPAVWWGNGERKRGFYKAANLQRRTAFKAHLLGVVMVGTYPFRGVLLRCGCPWKKHTCVGGGTSYLCLDLDAHNGETDTFERVSAVVSVCRSMRLFPLVATSRSGNGAHVFLFLNRRVSTATANAAGRVIAAEAGINSRCDVIPSAGHYKGFGTLHALPLSPLCEVGGGRILDADLRPLSGQAVVRALRWANAQRSDASVIERLVPARDAEAREPRARRESRGAEYARVSRLRAAPGSVLASVLKHHPQFRRVLTMDPERWRGKRSSRDAYLVGYLRRQGFPTGAIAQVVAAVPGSKTAERGMDYAVALVEAQDGLAVAPCVPLAGQVVPQQSALYGHEPWLYRVAPPREYGGLENPWWRADVQARLALPGQKNSKIDPVLLAYLIDRYFRGPIRRRMFFASAREIGETLGFKPRAVANAINRLAKRVPDILRVVPGVPHPHLRIATAFYVVDPGHKDCLDWYVRPGRSDGEPLSSGHASVADRDAGPGPEHASADYPRRAQGAADLDADGVRGKRAGAVLRGEPGVAPRPEGVLVQGPVPATPRSADPGRPQRRDAAPGRDASTGDVRSPTVPTGPAAVHRGGGRRRRRERAWRDAESTYKIG